MNKSKVIKAAEEYKDLFEENEDQTHAVKSEYKDFVNLHFKEKSKLLYDLSMNIGESGYKGHSKSVLRFLANNDSILNHKGNNFLSSINNSTLITILIFLLPSLISLGFYFGYRDSKQLDDVNDKLDLIISTSTSSTTQEIPNKKANIDYHNNNHDTLKDSNFNPNY
jgi:hypothetical protein